MGVCSVRDGTVYVNQVPSDPSTLDYVLNHEYIHVMEFARGSTEADIGPILADVLVLSNDADHPLAAYAARRVLGLTGRDDHPVIAQQDWFHIEHYVLEDVGWDVANLPAWYRAARPHRGDCRVGTGQVPPPERLRDRRREHRARARARCVAGWHRAAAVGASNG